MPRTRNSRKKRSAMAREQKLPDPASHETAPRNNPSSLPPSCTICGKHLKPGHRSIELHAGFHREPTNRLSSSPPESPKYLTLRTETTVFKPTSQPWSPGLTAKRFYQDNGDLAWMMGSKARKGYDGSDEGRCGDERDGIAEWEVIGIEEGRGGGDEMSKGSNGIANVNENASDGKGKWWRLGW